MKPEWMENGHPVADGYRLVVSVSGGKDSVATCLHLMELGYTPDDYDRVFMDTGWESARSYEYLREVLPGVIGPITVIRKEVKLEGEALQIALQYEERLGHYSSMVRQILKDSLFPRSSMRWCTRELKMRPLRNYLDGMGSVPVNVVGIRGAESHSRSKMAEHDWSDGLDCPVWRPIIGWSFDDVVAIHHRHSLKPNPLYFSGAERVGCWPCIFARKSELRSMFDQDPNRVSLIADLERDVTRLCNERREAAGSAQLPERTFFRSRIYDGTVWPIDKVVQWSRTTRGGRQFELFSSSPRDSGCVRWGMCDVATSSAHTTERDENQTG